MNVIVWFILGGCVYLATVISLVWTISGKAAKRRDKVREWRKGQARKRWLRWRISKRGQAHLDHAFPWAYWTAELQREGYGQPHIRDPRWADINQQQEDQ